MTETKKKPFPERIREILENPPIKQEKNYDRSGGGFPHSYRTVYKNIVDIDSVHASIMEEIKKIVPKEREIPKAIDGHIKIDGSQDYSAELVLLEKDKVWNACCQKILKAICVDNKSNK